MDALERGYQRIIEMHPKISRNAHPTAHLGTLGTGIILSKSVWTRVIAFG